MEENDGKEREEIYANAVRAGKRTYFFDVRSTKNNDYYLTITESKKRFNDDGSVSYQKHKLFLYKEDFEKFSDALGESFRKIIELKKEQSNNLESRLDNQFTDISFDQLGEASGSDESK
ncbi:MAG TPA: DNA-binding protein [Flavobacteriales bacterium]|nr:DNA-binding protein [Flavobacteriales bacterium]